MSKKKKHALNGDNIIFYIEEININFLEITLIKQFIQNEIHRKSNFKKWKSSISVYETFKGPNMHVVRVTKGKGGNSIGWDNGWIIFDVIKTANP